MAVRLRLALLGKKHAPMFRIVAIDSRKMRDGKYLENLGTYNPTTGEYVQFHPEKLDAWILKGAIPSDSVKKLYKRFKKGVQPKTKVTPVHAVRSTKAKAEAVETETIVVEAIEAQAPQKEAAPVEIKEESAQEEIKAKGKKAEKSEKE